MRMFKILCVLMLFPFFCTILQAQTSEWELYYSGQNGGILSIVVDNEGDIWYGSYYGVIGKITADSSVQYQLPSLFKVYSLDCDQDNNIWISTHDTGLVKFDGNEFTFIDMRTIFTRFPNYNNALFIRVDISNNIQVGSGFGLAIFDGTNWAVYDDNNSPLLAVPEINTLVNDDQQNIWFTSYYGAGKFDRQQDWQFWSGNYGPLLSCAIESNNTVWFVNEQGLVCTLKNDTLIDFEGTRCAALSSYQLAIDSSDVKWFTGYGTSGKASAYNDIELIELMIPYTEIEMAGTKSVYIDRLNNKWFGFENGYVVKYSGDFPTSVKERTDIINSKFQLHQNYPNPFNPGTIIKFIVPSEVKRQTSKVNVTVYDAMGREIVVLVNEEKSAGSYEVEFNASSFSSGIYFYQLVSGSFVETKKMVLLR